MFMGSSFPASYACVALWKQDKEKCGEGNAALLFALLYHLNDFFIQDPVLFI